MEIDLWRPLAGLSLFLFSMSIIERALEDVSGRAFRRFLRRNTDHPIRGIGSGTLATAILQSSSLVGVMMLALVGAGVIQMRNALSVIFGANLGTTMTGWIVATIGFKLDLDALALPLIAAGGLAAMGIRDHRASQIARVVFGVGLLLMGLDLMKGAVGNISDAIDVAVLGELGAVEYLLFGLVFTAIVQSSSATMMVTLSALHGGIIDLPAAAAVVIGADLGTTGTVLLAALRGSAAKKRVAMGHFLFNLITDLNLIGILMFLPLIGRFAGWLEGRFTDTETSVSRHLADVAVDLPEAAVEAIRLETNHLMQRVICQNLKVPDPEISLPAGSLPVGVHQAGAIAAALEPEFEAAYAASKRLEGEIITFAADAQAASLEKSESDLITRCQFAAREAVHASKSLKDARGDLRAFALSHRPILNGYGNRFREIMSEFYARLFLLRHGPTAERADGGPELEDLIVLSQLAHQRHEELHTAIYEDVRADRLDEDEISSLLNANRELFNSNRALLSAIATITLPPEQAATFDLLPTSVV
jgi:phosphate:Na+ symporter